MGGKALRLPPRGVFVVVVVVVADNKGGGSEGERRRQRISPVGRYAVVKVRRVVHPLRHFVPPQPEASGEVKRQVETLKSV